ncbi:hypothetical protein P4233_24180 [Pseudomonas aeruginosa]|nr:hypothetical protein [Pseudomonas aeruginosa]
MRWISRPGWPGHLLALAAGALTPLALAPFDYWPLAILSIALLYPRLAAFPASPPCGAAGGTVSALSGAGTSWIYVDIHDYGAASVPLASLLMLGFTAGVAFFFAPAGLAVGALPAPRQRAAGRRPGVRRPVAGTGAVPQLVPYRFPLALRRL